MYSVLYYQLYFFFPFFAIVITMWSGYWTTMGYGTTPYPVVQIGGSAIPALEPSHAEPSARQSLIFYI